MAKRQTPNEKAERVYDLEERLLDYSARIIRFVDSLSATKAASRVGGQLLRSGTSPLACHGEAQAAESIDDFIHKLKLCLKELQESLRWLRLIRLTPLLAQPKRAESLIDETEQLVRIFSKSIRTAANTRSNRVNELPSENIDPWLIRPSLVFGVESLAFGVQPPEAQISYEPRPRMRKFP